MLTTRTCSEMPATPGPQPARVAHDQVDAHAGTATRDRAPRVTSASSSAFIFIWIRPGGASGVVRDLALDLRQRAPS